jgi:hypothetical protein
MDQFDTLNEFRFPKTNELSCLAHFGEVLRELKNNRIAI